MPSNKKEEIIFGFMMVFGMVSIMLPYNFTLEDLWGEMSLVKGSTQFVLTFIVAFIIEAFVVGTIARKIAFKLPYNKTNKVYTIIAISTCMVVGMVSSSSSSTLYSDELCEAIQ